MGGLLYLLSNSFVRLSKLDIVNSLSTVNKPFKTKPRLVSILLKHDSAHVLYNITASVPKIFSIPDSLFFNLFTILCPVLDKPINLGCVRLANPRSK